MNPLSIALNEEGINEALVLMTANFAKEVGKLQGQDIDIKEAVAKIRPQILELAKQEKCSPALALVKRMFCKDTKENSNV